MWDGTPPGSPDRSLIDPPLPKNTNSYLAEEIGRKATQETAKAQAVPAWTETKRDFENYAKRKGDLPLQKEGETIDFRNVLHRCVVRGLRVFSWWGGGISSTWID